MNWLRYKAAIAIYRLWTPLSWLRARTEGWRNRRFLLRCMGVVLTTAFAIGPSDEWIDARIRSGKCW